jgi:flavin reductase (DIM6/NTAB) family NADH-FMN oxidoreductase RutF
MNTTIPQFDRSLLRAAFGCFPSGVTAVCGMSNGAPHGMTASSFTSVSLEPPLVSVCVAHTSTTWPKLAQLRRLGVSVLAAGHSSVAKSLASRSADRFSDVQWVATRDGAVLVRGATLWLECEIFEQVPAGDHDIVILRIAALEPRPDIAPMIFHHSTYRELAPTASATHS